jgi:methylated-DNA-[protein]-cysteine S-methyltransferase
MKSFSVVSIPGGSVGFVASERGLSDVVVMGRLPKEAVAKLAQVFPDAWHEKDLLPGFQHQLRDYFAGRLKRFDVKLDLSSLKPFQRQVLDRCARIGYGRTKTYGELAREIGRPRAARAVGGALGRNPVPLVIPCHRVVAGDGSLGGFSAEQGVKLKRRLLELESGVRTSS